jgi:hypothetical protein
MDPMLERSPIDVETPHHAARRLGGRRNGWVVLDQAWAARLGVPRTGGVYRIRHRELLGRLARLQVQHADHTAGAQARRGRRGSLRIVVPHLLRGVLM